MRFRWLVLFALFLSVLFPPAAPAQDTPTAVQPPTTAITHYTLPPDKLEKAHALYTVRTTLHFGEIIYGIVLLLIILGIKLGPRLRDLAERVTHSRFGQAFIFVPLLTIVIDLCTLPFGIYGHNLSLRYGLSVQRWGSWFWDWTKGELIGIVISSLLLWVLYILIQRSPRRWWFYAWLLMLPVLVIVIWAVPVLLDPVFNKFEPLAKHHMDLVDATHKVADAAHVQIGTDRMFLMLASEKVTTENAYVTGLGSTKRVVVWDTTAKEMTVPEVTFVIAHEMGHYVLNHIYKGLAFAALTMFFGFYIAYRLLNVFLARWGSSLAIRGPSDWASLPALMLIASVIGIFADPIGNSFSRTQIEHKADVYGLEITSQITPDYRQVAAQSFQNLGEHSLSYPYPSKLMVLLFYDHPDISSRVQYALHFQPGQK